MIPLPHAHQRTLRSRIAVEGVGLHSGRSVRMTLLPAPVDAGVTFVRTDLPHLVEIPARSEFVTDTMLNTTLGRDGVKVGTVEHLLAALYGLGVDNVRVELDGPEVPILDGSAEPFVRLVVDAGVREQKAARRMLVVRRTVTVTDGDKEARLTPGHGFHVGCSIDFNHALITDQKHTLEVTPRTFLREIATARTFGFVRDIEMLRARGLALGGSLENAIVVDDFHIRNPEGLRFPDEFVRHKILDAIGDLSLVGLPLVGQFHAHKTGHALNQKLVRKLLADDSAYDVVTLDLPAPRAQPAGASVELVAAFEGQAA